MTASFLDEAASGYRSTLIAQAVRVACKAASVLVLGRIVAPAEHGLYAMAASVFFLLVIFRDLGLGAAALQARSLSEEQHTTLCYAHIVLGAVLALVAAGLSPVAAAFYHERRVIPLVITLAVGLFLLGLNAWPRVLLSRALRFHDSNRLEVVAAIIATLAMITAGALGAGAYSFATYLLVSEGVILVLAWSACRWRPQAAAQWQSLQGFWGTAANVTGFNILLAILQQADVALMGRWFGPAAAGFYSRPAQVLTLPMQHVGAPLSQVLLATLSRVPPSSANFALHVRTTSSLIAHLTLPLAAVCAILTEEVIRLLLGPNWPDAAPLLRWLAVGAVASYLSATVYAACVAGGHARRLTGMSALSLAATITGLWLGRPYGPQGLAAGVALANVAVLPVRLWWTTRQTSLRLRDFANAFAGPGAMTAIAALGMAAGRAFAAEAHWTVRLGSGLAGGTVAAGALMIAWPRLRREWEIVWHWRRPRKAVSPAP